MTMKTYQIHFRHGAVIERLANSVEYDGRLLILITPDSQARMRDNDIISCHIKHSNVANVELTDTNVFCLLDHEGEIVGYCRNERALQNLYDAEGPQKPQVIR